MISTRYYDSPLGRILLSADETGLTGLWFEGSMHFALGLPKEHRDGVNKTLLNAKQWLDIYFSGENPGFIPPIHLVGTSFQKKVWNILLEIPYGKTISYGEIATKIVKEEGIQKMSSQAVGGAVGHNKISIIIPCHRVVGSNGSLTGYAAGLDKKIKLLEIEHISRTRFCSLKAQHEAK